jgi:mannan endo-1,4-beta-mannosidase
MKRVLCIKVMSAILTVFAVLVPVKADEPVNGNSSPEARALLELFYNISGKYLLTGQHNFPAIKDWNSRFFKEYTGKTPVIWSTDMGFAKYGDKDSYLARPDNVREAIRQHKKGSLITICWHAVPPTADEPVTFQPQGRVSPDSLASVQGRLTDEQFREILTPGTMLYKRWAQQVDSVAGYLKQLSDASVPVLWRPYHEMNGDWFWWGGRVGSNSTADLYRQLYDRLVNYHKLNNLIWVWSVDRPSTPVRKFSNFYPGNQFVDILALDVYGNDFNQAYYDSLTALSEGKPVVLGEVGNPPSPEVLNKQPRWSYWVIWSGMTENTSKQKFVEYFGDRRILTRESPEFSRLTQTYRKTGSLPLLPLKARYPVDFSGMWLFNEDKSQISNGGTGSIPRMIDIEQDDEMLLVRKTLMDETGSGQVVTEDLCLDGVELPFKIFNSPGIISCSWDDEKKAIIINRTAIFGRGDRKFEFRSSEVWHLDDSGKTLRIDQTSSGFRGTENTVYMVFEKR